MASNTQDFGAYIRRFPKKFQEELAEKLAFKSALEEDERLRIPSRIWLAFLTPRDAVESTSGKFKDVADLKKKMLETFEHPRLYIDMRDPHHRSGSCVTLSVLEILFDLHEGKILLKKDRYYEWLDIANHFGLWKLRYALEDAIFKTFDPENYSLFESVVKQKMFMDQHIVTAIRGIIADALKRAGLKNFHIKNRKKNIFGVYEKVGVKNININEIYDIHGFRIITSSEKDCYKAADVLHRLWPRLPERYKDYIKNPKDNGYRSLHTVVSCLEQKPIEFQMRTEEMDVIAASGPANHAAYKKVRTTSSTSLRK